MAKKSEFILTQESVAKAIDKLKSLSPKEMKAVNKQTMRKAGNVLKSETARGVKREIRNANAPSARHPGMTPPAKGVRTYVAKSGTWAKVSIFNKDSFLLAIFEKGTAGARTIKGQHSWKYTKTKRRYKAGINRGAISAKRFFETARRQVNERVKTIIEEETVKAVNRQWQKKN